MTLETYNYPTDIILFAALLIIVGVFVWFMIIIFFMSRSGRNKADINHNKYKKFKEDTILIWYDGPLLKTMIDKKGNHYIEHNDDYSAFAKVTIDDLLQILRNEKPINFAFKNSNEKYNWKCNNKIGIEAGYYRTDELETLSLFEEDVFLKDCGLTTECCKPYIDELESRRLGNEYKHVRLF